MDSPVQENLPDAGPVDQALDPNFLSDEIKMPANIPAGFAGNSDIYHVRIVSPSEWTSLTYRLRYGRTSTLVSSGKESP